MTWHDEVTVQSADPVEVSKTAVVPVAALAQWWLDSTEEKGETDCQWVLDIEQASSRSVDRLKSFESPWGVELIRKSRKSLNWSWNKCEKNNAYFFSQREERARRKMVWLKLTFSQTQELNDTKSFCCNRHISTYCLLLPVWMQPRKLCCLLVFHWCDQRSKLELLIRAAFLATGTCRISRAPAGNHRSHWQLQTGNQGPKAKERRQLREYIYNIN